MPTSRLLPGTKIPSEDEKTLRSPMTISPSSGRSRPATLRSVVVLPQPDGPSSVKKLPGFTSKLTPASASTPPSCVFKDLRKFETRIISNPSEAQADANAPRDQAHPRHQNDDNDPERVEACILPAFVEIEYQHRDHLRAGVAEKDRKREDFEGQGQDVNPARQHARQDHRSAR